MKDKFITFLKLIKRMYLNRKIKKDCQPLQFVKIIKKMYFKEFKKEMNLEIDATEKFKNSLEKAIYEIILKNKNKYQIYEEKPINKKVIKLVDFFIEIFPNFNQSISNIKMDDILVLLNTMYISQYEHYILIRYDEKAIWNNPYISGKNTHWEMYNQLLRQCRSIILDLKEEEIVSLPFPKFLNLNETTDYSFINIQNRLEKAKIIEYSNKLDGDFFQITKYKNEFIYSSSSSLIDSNVRVWMKEDLDKQPYIYELANEYSDETCIFEWINQKDRKVVNYNDSEDGFYLIGMRNKITGKLKKYSEIIAIAKKYNLNHTTIFDFKNFEECILMCENIKGKEQEGFVLRIDDFLVKLKGKDYCEIVLLLKNNSSFNIVIRKYVSNEIDDILANIPEQHRIMIENQIELIKTYEKEMTNLLEYYLSRMPNGDKKDIFIWINSNVPSFIKRYVSDKYNHPKKDINFLGKNLNTKNPSYLIEKDIVKNLEVIQALKKTL